jgi:(2Fe-2S) ferredoxin
MANLSLIISQIKQFAYINKVADIATLNVIASNNGCPTNQIDDVINGVIRDSIMNMITPKVNNVTVTDANGNEIKEEQYNPTRQTLERVIIDSFQGIDSARAQNIVDKMIDNGYLIEDRASGKLYRGVVPPTNLPFAI